MYQSPVDGTCGALIRWGTEQLLATEEAPGEAVREAGLLLASALAVPRASLLAFPERPAPRAARERYAGWIGRRAQGEPIAYLLGRREFWSLELEVTPAVLVPRPETELLVERALELGTPRACAVLDLGTGSGAIALALAGERPAWQITATDVSPAALAVARRNARRHRLERVEFLFGDWFAAVGSRRFDLIVSNPPYVAGDDPALERSPLRHEPRLALTPGSDPLAAFRRIAAAALEHLEPAGWLLLEHAAVQAVPLAEMLVAQGFGHVRSRRDLAGLERVTEARGPPYPSSESP